MSNKGNDELWDLATDIVEERIAKNSLPEEAKNALIQEVYENLMSQDPPFEEEEIL